jgi:GT2 family glycosyltransferase
MAGFYPRSKKFGFYRMGWWNYRSAQPVEQPMASSLLLRRGAIESVLGATSDNSEDMVMGGTISGDPWLFDPEFPIYFNDVDLCWRLWQAGWEIWYLPEAHVRHWGGAATSQIKPEMIAESHRSLERFYRKHWKGRYHPFLFVLTLWLVRLSGRWRVWRARTRESRIKSL